MQIKQLEKNALSAAAEILASCTDNAKCELSGYFTNKTATVYGAFDKDALCGVLVVMYTPDFADVLDIAVHSSVRRTGIGGALMEYCTAECKKRGVGAQLLEVRASNANAISFYEKLGFEKISERKNYYSAPGEDALIYRREL